MCQVSGTRCLIVLPGLYYPAWQERAHKRGGLFLSPRAPWSSNLAVRSALLTYNLNLPFDVFGILAFLPFSLSQKFRPYSGLYGGFTRYLVLGLRKVVNASF